MKEAWLKKEAAEVLGVTPRTIHFYTDEGLIIPGISNPRGKGTKRRYSARNLLEILIVRGLAEIGLNLSKIKEGIGHLKRTGLLNGLKPGLRCYLIVYDADTEHPLFESRIFEEGKPIDLDMGEGKRRHFAVSAIDITGMREKVRGLLA